MEFGQKCGVFAGESASAGVPRDCRSGISLRELQRGGGTAESEFAVVVASTRAGAAERLGGVHGREHRVFAAEQSQGAGVCAADAERNNFGGREFVALRAGGGVEFGSVQGLCAGGIVWAGDVSGSHGCGVFADVVAVCVLLVCAHAESA